MMMSGFRSGHSIDPTRIYTLYAATDLNRYRCVTGWMVAKWLLFASVLAVINGLALFASASVGSWYSESGRPNIPLLQANTPAQFGTLVSVGLLIHRLRLESSVASLTAKTSPATKPAGATGRLQCLLLPRPWLPLID